MPEGDTQLRALLQTFLGEHKRRKQTAIFGTRKADEALMALCDFVKANTFKLSDQAKAEVVRTIQGMDLLPYRAYCREHLLDIGITNVQPSASCRCRRGGPGRAGSLRSSRRAGTSTGWRTC